MERFDSGEEVKWAKGPYNDGYEARTVYQVGLDQCPNAETIGAWAAKSWRAGWADADMDYLAVSESQREEK